MMKKMIVLSMTSLLVFALAGCTCESALKEDDSYDSVTPVSISLDNTELPTFHGYECTDDCSGHEAGYEWAEEHDITDPSDCGGKSDSFIEGCEAYAEEYSY